MIGKRNNTNRDKFYYLIESKHNDRHRYNAIFIALIVDVFLLFCVAFDWKWWGYEYNSSMAITLFMAIYFFVICAEHFREGQRHGLLDVWSARMNCWRYYYKSPDIIYHDEYAPIVNEDYVLLSSFEYMKANTKSENLELTDLYNREVYYSVRYKDSDEYEYSLRHLRDILKEEGKSIISIYNKYGDVRWEQSDKFVDYSKKRKWVYKILFSFLCIFYLILVFSPILFIICYITINPCLKILNYTTS